MTGTDVTLPAMSPFHSRAAQYCRTNLWTLRRGMTLVDLYESLDADYAALDAAALIDRSYWQTLRIAGREAGAGLDHALSVRASILALGARAETVWLDRRGRVVGQGVLVRAGEEDYLLASEAPSFAYLSDALEGYDAHVDDVSALYGRLALVGPAAPAVLEAAFQGPRLAVKEDRAIALTVRGLTIQVARAGAEDRPFFDVWVEADRAGILWDRLIRAGQGFGVRPAGVAVDRVARLEAGRPEIDVDFQAALRDDGSGRVGSPAVLGLGLSAADLSGGDGGKRRLIALEIEGGVVPVGSAVTRAGRPIGRLTSVAWSPGTLATLALAWLEAPLGAPDGGPLAVQGPEGVLRPARLRAGRVPSLASSPVPER